MTAASTTAASVTPGQFGVYVHVPFCRERCDYCAFATYTDRDHLMGRYADACVAELATEAMEVHLDRRIRSVRSAVGL